MTEEKILPTFPWKWFIFGMVVMLLSTMFFMGYNYESAGASGYNRGTADLTAMYDDGILLGILMVVGLIPALTPLGRKIGPDKYALIYTFWHLGYSMAWMGAFQSFAMFSNLWRRWPYLASLVPSYFSLPVPSVNNFVTGGPLDWAAVMPAVGWWTSVTMVMAFMQYFMGVIWRRQLIEIDRLPYPIQIPTIEVIKQITTPMSEKSGEGGIVNQKFLWIGFGLGWLIFVWDIVHMVAPSIPRPAKPVENIRGWGNIYYNVYQQSGIPIHMLVTFDIRHVPLLLGLLPMDIVTSLFTWGILWFVIAPPVGRAIGYYDVTTEPGTTVNIFQFPMLRHSGPGALMGIAIFFLWHSRGHLRTVLGALRGRRDLDDPGLSYRIAVPGFIATIVVLLAMNIGSGVLVEWALFFVVYNLIFALGIMRLRGEVWEAGNGYHFGNYVERWLPLLPRDEAFRQSSATVTTVALGQFMATHNDTYRDSMNKVPDSLKVSREVGGIDRQIIMAIIIGTIIGVPFAAFFRIWLGFSGNWTAGIPGGWWVANDFYKGTWYGSTDVQLQAYWGGAVAAIVLMFLRARFAWFFFNPVAIAAWDTMRMFGGIYLFEIAIVFVARLLIWKLGGAKIQRIVTLGCIGFLGGFYSKELLNWILGRFVIGIANIPGP